MAEVASRNLGEERSVRVQDYLDDKLQTSNDLANLDVLLETVTNQQTLLRQQVALFRVWCEYQTHYLLASRGGNGSF